MSLVAVSAFTACSNDELSSDSIFDTSEVQRSEFDKWLKTNYTDTYNIEFNYLYNDKYSENEYNVVPATLENSKAIAILMKYIWMDAYSEVAGSDFLKKHCFRQMQLIGSAMYNSQSSIVRGSAEGGLSVNLYCVNELDINNIFINQNNPYRGHFVHPIDLNHWYFFTMHHEFCHILTQITNYSTDFQTISSGKYHSADWVNLSDEDAAMEGFVTGYASSEYNEDFAETYAKYVVYSDEGWNKILAHGVDTLSCDTIYEDYVDENGQKVYATDKKGSLIPETDSDGNIIYIKDSVGNFVPKYQYQQTARLTNVEVDTSGRDAILQKLEIIRAYFKDTWGIDLDELRAVVLRRSAEAYSLDLKTLK